MLDGPQDLRDLVQVFRNELSEAIATAATESAREWDAVWEHTMRTVAIELTEPDADHFLVRRRIEAWAEAYRRALIDPARLFAPLRVQEIVGLHLSRLEHWCEEHAEPEAVERPPAGRPSQAMRAILEHHTRSTMRWHHRLVDEGNVLIGWPLQAVGVDAYASRWMWRPVSAGGPCRAVGPSVSAVNLYSYPVASGRRLGGMGTGVRRSLWMAAVAEVVRGQDAAWISSPEARAMGADAEEWGAYRADVAAAWPRPWCDAEGVACGVCGYPEWNEAAGVAHTVWREPIRRA